MAKVTLNDLSKALGLNEKEPNKDFHYYGTIVDSNPSDNTYQVSINRDANISVEAARLVGAGIGDTVMVTVMSNGYATVTNRLGGDKDAVDAQRKAVEAADSASSAANSASLAASSASQASASAASASTSAQNAETDATAAANSASNAASSATNASTSAQTAADAATSALTSAKTAADAATSASTDASDAKKDAATANNAASAAITQLDIVENIVGVLELISTKGEYAETTDPEVDPNKWYFELTDTGAYQVVQSPTGDPSAQGYYELIGIKESIQNYVSSHLVLDGNGLWLQTDGSSTKLQLSPMEGLVVYNELGNPVARYGSDTIIGDLNSFNIKIDSVEHEIAFYKAGTKVAYMTGEELHVKKRLSFGNFMFYQRTNGHFTLKYLERSGN